MDEPVSWQSPTLGPMAWVPPGRFLMGSPPEEVGRAVDEPQHWAEIGAGFWMMVHPVTQGQWAAVMGHNPSRFAGEGRELHPVEQVIPTR